MKKLILEISIISILVLMPSAVIAVDKVVIDADEHLIAAIVIDCSDIGRITWQRSLILARQAISMLHAGDELIIITANKDQNVIETTCRIDPNNTAQQRQLNQKLMALEYNWWCRTKIAEALQLAYSELNNRPSGRKNCIVISDGRYDNSAVEDIRRKATVYRLSGIPLLMTVTGTANQNLLLAGNQKELDITVLEQADLASWFDKVRPHRAITPIVITPKPTSPLPDVPTTPSQPPVPQQPKEDKSKVSEKVPDKTNLPKQTAEKPPLPAKERKSSRFKQLLSDMSPLILLAVIALCIYLIVKFSISNDHRKTEANDSGTDTEPGIIAAEYDGIKYELGDENTINNIVIGTSPASIIPLTESSLEEEHVKLSKKRGKFWIKNCSSQLITINNLPLEKGKTELLLLPARMQLADTVRIDLFKEIKAKTAFKTEGE
jgi:hypothetical protein